MTGQNYWSFLGRCVICREDFAAVGFEIAVEKGFAFSAVENDAIVCLLVDDFVPPVKRANTRKPS